MSWAAGFVSMFLGFGFGLPCVLGLRHFAQTGQVWTFMGFPTYGGGPFEQIGVQTSTALLVGFLSVCVAEVALAVMLWTGAPRAAAVGYAMLAFELPFWIGFALPAGPLLGIARTGLLLWMRTTTVASRNGRTDAAPAASSGRGAGT